VCSAAVKSSVQGLRSNKFTLAARLGFGRLGPDAG